LKSVQESSAAIEASARYSALVLDHATTICFLKQYEIKLLSKYTANPVAEHRVS
jgi:hypothetical protein